jgi:hypothetical protein
METNWRIGDTAISLFYIYLGIDVLRFFSPITCPGMAFKIFHWFGFEKADPQGLKMQEKE